MAEPITLAEAKAHLRVVSADDDAYITGLIVAARMMVEGRTQRALVVTTESVAMSAFPPVIELPRTPYKEVLQIAYLDDSDVWQEVDQSVYRVNTYTVPVQITLDYEQSWPTVTPRAAAIVVSYEAGYTDPAIVPAPLKQWMLLAIGAMFENREQIAAGVEIYAIPESFMGLLWQPYMVYG